MCVCARKYGGGKERKLAGNCRAAQPPSSQSVPKGESRKEARSLLAYVTGETDSTCSRVIIHHFYHFIFKINFELI